MRITRKDTHATGRKSDVYMFSIGLGALLLLGLPSGMKNHESAMFGMPRVPKPKGVVTKSSRAVLLTA